MNKFNVFVVALVAFAAVAQLVLANELVSEMDDNTDVDDELEGGFMDSKAQKKVGVSIVDQWGNDVLDKGLKKLNESRRPDCKHAKTKENCETCCEATGKAAKFNVLKLVSSAGACTCFSRDNAYSTVLA